MNKKLLEHKKLNVESYRQGILDTFSLFENLKKTSLDFVNDELKKIEEEINNENK